MTLSVNVHNVNVIGRYITLVTRVLNITECA